MGRFHRVFSRSEIMPDPEELLARLRAGGLAVEAHFRGDSAGWFSAEIIQGEGAPLSLERYLAGEEGIRAELNSWAAVLETWEDNPHQVPLMERVIQSTQLFILQDPGTPDAPVGVAVCRLLAELTDGVYQADGQGFFTAEGTLLLGESRPG
jgi:hypothetical protein